MGVGGHLFFSEKTFLGKVVVCGKYINMNKITKI